MAAPECGGRCPPCFAQRFGPGLPTQLFALLNALAILLPIWLTSSAATNGNPR